VYFFPLLGFVHDVRSPPTQQQIYSPFLTRDNGFQQARRALKLVMTTLISLSDGESTVILSAKKGDEEAGGSSATTDTDDSRAVSKTEHGSENLGDFPDDGGFEGWACVIGGWFALFSTFGWLNS
jgi:hypothetical protein